MTCNELQHYGVKGMKWGVRKKRYKSEFDSDMVLKKGTVIQNISGGKKRELDKGPMYTASTEKDKLSYAGVYADHLKNWVEVSVYKNDFKVVKDIKIPSQKKAVEIFTETLKNNPEQMARCIAKAKADISLFENLGKTFKMDVESRTYRKFMKKGDDWINTKGYAIFNQTLTTDKSAEARNAYFDNLLSKGYDGLLDTNDINNSYKSDSPVIVINPKNNLKEESSKRMTQRDIGLSMMKYAELYDKSMMRYAKSSLG